MPFTNGNDLNLLQSTDTLFVGAGAGNDRYILDASTLRPNQQITITDTQGLNTLHLVGGLQIVSSKVAATALQLTLNNGAVITVLGANTFQYMTGGNSLTGNGALVQNFADFASLGLKVTVPAPSAGFVDGSTVVVNQGGGASVPDTTAPAAPVINAVATDNIVNAAENTNLVISGTGEVGATVTLANTSQTAVVNAQGTWSITVADAAAAFGQGAETLSVTQQDAAGNTSQVAARAITVDTLPPVDTTPPAFLSAVTSADGTKLILSYGEALASATAAKEAFAVTVNGQPNAVTAVAVSGSTVELTLASAVISGQAITVAYTDPTAGNDASAVQDAAGNDTPTLAAQAVTNNAPIEGVVIDGYVAGATVYADIDGDGIQDPNEPFTTTDANGNYSLAANGNYRIVAYGGNDLMTGKAFEGVLTAPAGSTTISPITTLVQAALESGKTLEDATTEVRTALGLPEAVTDIVTYDPIAALIANQNDPTALAVQKAAQQVASVITQTTTAIDAADPTKSKKEVAKEVIKALSAAISSAVASQTTAAPVDLSQAETLTTIVTNAATATGTSSIVTNAASVAQVTASSNAQIQNATTLVNLNKAAVVSQVNAVQALQTAATNNTLGDAPTEFTNTVEQLVQEADTGKLTTEQPVETPPPTPPPWG